MIRKTHLRRVLLVSLVIAGLALAPPAAARVAAPARSGGAVTSGWPELGNRFVVVWHWLSNVWGQEGSSMDPFGHH